MKNPDCSSCTHFYITLDERRPRACRIFNIKGINFPSIDVRRFTGKVCPVYTPRQIKKNKVASTVQILDRFA